MLHNILSTWYWVLAENERRVKYVAELYYQRLRLLQTSTKTDNFHTVILFRTLRCSVTTVGNLKQVRLHYNLYITGRILSSHHGVVWVVMTNQWYNISPISKKKKDSRSIDNIPTCTHKVIFFCEVIDIWIWVKSKNIIAFGWEKIDIEFHN